MAPPPSDQPKAQSGCSGRGADPAPLPSPLRHLTFWQISPRYPPQSTGAAGQCRYGPGQQQQNRTAPGTEGARRNLKPGVYLGHLIQRQWGYLFVSSMPGFRHFSKSQLISNSAEVFLRRNSHPNPERRKPLEQTDR